MWMETCGIRRKERWRGRRRVKKKRAGMFAVGKTFLAILLANASINDSMAVF